MGYWKRMGRRFNEKIDKIVDTVEDTIDDASDFAESINNIKSTGRKVLRCADATHEMCETTQAKGDQMVEFGRGIQESLNSFDKSNMTASAIETIRDLTDGDKLKEAMEIAKGMDDIAIGCATKSVEMIDILDEAVAALPDRFEAYVGRQARRKFEEEDDVEQEALAALDRDILDVEDTVASVNGLHIASAFEVGVRAFKTLSEKAVSENSIGVLYCSPDDGAHSLLSWQKPYCSTGNRQGHVREHPGLCFPRQGHLERDAGVRRRQPHQEGKCETI